MLPDNDDEHVLLKPISYEPCHIDELIRESGLPTTTVSSTLAMMVLKGMVKQVGGDAICFGEIERSRFRTAPTVILNINAAYKKGEDGCKIPFPAYIRAYCTIILPMISHILPLSWHTLIFYTYRKDGIEHCRDDSPQPLRERGEHRLVHHHLQTQC